MKQQYDVLFKKLIGMGAVLICFLLLLPTLRFIPTEAQTTSTADTTRDSDFDSRIQTFFTAIKRGDYTSAFEGLLHQSLLASLDTEQRSKFRSGIDDLEKEFGKLISWERYESKDIGKDIVQVRYIFKYEQHPVIWTFSFYRKPVVAPISGTSTSWVLVGLNFDTELR